MLFIELGRVNESGTFPTVICSSCMGESQYGTAQQYQKYGGGAAALSSKAEADVLDLVIVDFSTMHFKPAAASCWLTTSRARLESPLLVPRGRDHTGKCRQALS